MKNKQKAIIFARKKGEVILSKTRNMKITTWLSTGFAVGMGVGVLNATFSIIAYNQQLNIKEQLLKIMDANKEEIIKSNLETVDKIGVKVAGVRAFITNSNRDVLEAQEETKKTLIQKGLEWHNQLKEDNLKKIREFKAYVRGVVTGEGFIKELYRVEQDLFKGQLQRATELQTRIYEAYADIHKLFVRKYG